jgi:hypothetical protein
MTQEKVPTNLTKLLPQCVMCWQPDPMFSMLEWL